MMKLNNKKTKQVVFGILALVLIAAMVVPTVLSLVL